MVNIFDYENYRDYLAAYFKEKKAQNPHFSYQVFSSKAGFNRTFMHAVVTGSKNLGKASIGQISQAIGHTKKEQEYFENLVGYNQSEKLAVKNRYFDNLKTIRNTGKGFSEARLLRQDQFDFYSQWHHAAIRSIINQVDFKDNYEWLAKTVRPQIKPSEARKSVELLERLGLIRKSPSGYYRISDKTISTGKETQSHAVLKFHEAMATHALSAIRELPRDKRFLTGLTLGISRKTYESLCEKMQSFVSEALDMAKKDEDSDGVYHMNFHLFPISRTDLKRRP